MATSEQSQDSIADSESSEPTRILHVGRDPADAERVRQLLAASVSCRFDVVHADRVGQKLHAPEAKELDVLLLTVPDDLVEAKDRIQDARRQAPDLPLLVLCDQDDEAVSLALLRSGARGVILKSELTTRRLVTSVMTALESHSVIRQLSIARERERHLITHDHLTSLPNRVSFGDRLFQALVEARSNDTKLAVVWIDLDNFAVINETLGYAVGDGLLRSVTGHLNDAIRGVDVAARIGADEFALLLTDLDDAFEAAGIADKILAALCRPIPLRSRSIIATGSIGIAAFPRDGADAETLMQGAHTAMEHAKKRGGNRYEFYTTDMSSAVDKRATLEDRLRSALNDNDLELYYQPQFDLRREKVVGAEALIRWRHPDYGLLGPEAFLSLAEESGLIVPLGDWVLRTACQQNSEWQECGHAGFRISVNVSPLQLRDRDFTTFVSEVLEESGLQPECLELEITEGSLVQDAEGTVNALHSLKELGVHLAIDDFGTGYSALSYLKHLPIDVLKIDQSFIRTLTTDPADATIVETVLRMAKGLHLTTVAEGVETQEQLLLLGSLGCTRMQGYLFGKPVPADQLVELIDHPVFSWNRADES